MEYEPFSVAISVYKSDNPDYFDRALESITDNQTIKPNEIVLVVDGPVPESINKVINKYIEKCVFKVIRLEKNGGLGNALRIATENCSYELIARMDSDDISVPDRFEQELIAFRDNQVDVVGGDITEFVGEENNVVAKRVVPLGDKRIKKEMRNRCSMNHVTVMMRRTALFKSGGYLDWFCNEDYYLWIRMCLNNCVFANTGTTLVNVRTGLDMYARRGGKKYFSSEAKLQKYMLRVKFISIFRFWLNIFKRFVVQLILPNRLRGFVYKTIARK